MKPRIENLLFDLADALHAQAQAGEPLQPLDMRAIAETLDAAGQSLRNSEYHRRRALRLVRVREAA